MVFRLLKSGYQKVKEILSKTGSLLGRKLRNLFSHPIDEERLEELEKLFYEADFGVKTSLELTEKVKDFYQKNPSISPDECIHLIREEILHLLPPAPSFEKTKEKPTIILIVGVNGNGKTTTVAKLAKKFSDQGDKVLLGAADTFRAAAIDQLQTWADRLKVDLVKGKPNSDPAAVTYDAVQAGIARKADVILIDTAGRLHTKTHLMQQLDKIRRTCQKLSENAPHEVFLVLDATTGQNAIDQAKIFHEYTSITGLILTKLDGTAKGGIVIQIQRDLNIPVRFIGIGEGIEDLELFDPEKFVKTLLE